MKMSVVRLVLLGPLSVVDCKCRRKTPQPEPERVMQFLDMTIRIANSVFKDESSEVRGFDVVAKEK